MTKALFSAIWAQTATGGMGIHNTLPWPHSPADMEWFRKHTMGKPIVMGHNTYKSLGIHQLNGRLNVVISKTQPVGAEHLNTYNGHETNEGLYWIESVERFLETVPSVWDTKEIMIIGGPKTYVEFKEVIERVYTTTFMGEFEAEIGLCSQTDAEEAFHTVYYDEFSSKEVVFRILERIDPSDELDIEVWKVND
ncbi:dihydrofolate reductase [Aeromonas phage D3]|uniref:dihydrofolate reductase n=1 Tax=Aeromonas phage D3 TaxID=2593327 RepID=A0A514TV97_9CAUD|nr:dihydrofolate reductase [Aeromonas phage D3]QDJ96934.1 putative dihydrofolate reductase [Aeromonas phage D3]QEP52240.1 dihydrofolate reductase [Aeromonas phage D9]